ncbi:MAG: acetyl-CoA synthase subunit gamma, partial [Desulfomonile tiedjei]|nr:acetyl-CoA synthase subunit gamma [Desulfomonile tiedjei]
MNSPVGRIPRVSSELTFADRLGSFKARWKIGRMTYFIDPGLYALGAPDANSQVLVTANYKMSFDWLRSVLPGMNAWILALNTDGINVWCAAGKGTFGTEELVNRIESSGLGSVVSHRQLILPQLGAPGVAAHQVKRLSGFKVIYGPIRAEDIPAFVASGFKATPEMRRKTFGAWERTVLIPVELVSALEVAVFVIPAFFFFGGLGGPFDYWSNVLNFGVFAAIALLCALVAGTILAPIFLPWLPGRA